MININFGRELRSLKLNWILNNVPVYLNEYIFYGRSENIENRDIKDICGEITLSINDSEFYENVRFFNTQKGMIVKELIKHNYQLYIEKQGKYIIIDCDGWMTN